MIYQTELSIVWLKCQEYYNLHTGASHSSIFKAVIASPNFGSDSAAVHKPVELESRYARKFNKTIFILHD